MKKIEVLVFFTLFLTLLSFRGYAELVWSNPINITPTSYSPTTYSTFNTTWTNSTPTTNITQVNITINYTGTPTNYTMSKIFGDEYNSTWGFQEILGSGTYQWRSCAIDNNTNENCTDYYNFTIEKAIPISNMKVEINRSNSNQSLAYPTSTNVTAYEINSNDNCTYNLYRNDAPIIGNNETVTFRVNNYTYIFNTSGCTNYSSGSLIRILNITKGTEPIHLYLNDTEGNKSYNLNSIANFTVFLNVTGKTVYLNSTFSNFTTQSGSSIIYNWTNLSSSGLFNLTAYWDGDENYSASSTTYYFDNIAPQYFITSPGLTDTYDFNKTYWFNISVSAATINKTILEFNGTNNYTANGYFGNYWYSLRDLFAGNYTYRWIINNSLNIINSTGIINYTVSKQTPSVIMLFFPSASITYGIQSNVTCYNVTPYQFTSIKLYRSLSLINSGICSVSDVQTLSEATYNYNCTIDGTQNYTSYSISNNLIVGPATLTPGQNSGTTPTQNTTGSFTITSSSYSVTMEPNTSKTVTLTLSNAFSYDIININLSVSGINSSWYTLDKTLVSRLRHDGGTNATQLTLKVPSDAERKIYSIVFTASGKDFSLNKITRQTTITLTVPSEQAQQNETQGNQTQNETNATNATANETNITTGSNVNENNNFLTFLTGLLIKPEYFRNIVLFAGLIAAGLVFLFRSNITEFLTGSLSGKAQTKKEVSKEKKPLFSSIKDKFSKYSDSRIVIHVKKEEKEKKEKV